MQFRTDRPIFQQIIEMVEDQIVKGALSQDERVPAVRDYALALEVNPNTVVRSFADLEGAGVIFKKRGLGYFVSSDARDKIVERRRQVFLKEELPAVVAKMRLLNVSLDTFQTLYKNKKNEIPTLFKRDRKVP